MKSNGDIDSVDWVYFKVGDYDYELQNGDITMQRPYAKHHGDIVTPAGRVGGNLGGPGSVNATKSKTTGIVTKSVAAKKLIVGERGDISESKYLKQIFDIIEEIQNELDTKKL